MITIKRVTRLIIAFTCFSTCTFAAPSIDLNTILTSNKETPTDTHTFSKDTLIIYIIWKSDQLKEGEKIKNIWVAEDTHNVAPPNYKIDSSEMTLNEEGIGALLSHLPGSYWKGTFSLSKPNNGWPLGTYHVDIYVNDDLIKSIPFNIADNPSGTPPDLTKPATTVKAGDWDAIAVDTASHDKDMAAGIGAGATKDEAGQNALKFCTDAEGAKCAVVVSYQQCGAFAVSENGQGLGTGATKEAAEQQAKDQCKIKDCEIVVSDCVK